MAKSINNKPIVSFLRHFLSITIFWVFIIWVYHINELPVDGGEMYGMPYPFLKIFYSRKTNTLYDYVFSYENLFWDILFVIIVTTFYFFLFKNLERSKS
jgi:hypothetical protein